MNHHESPLDFEIVDLRNAQASSSVVIVCEHASAFIPAQFDHLGVAEDARASHVAWDPGALSVAERMSAQLDAVLIAAKTSRLVYDCNRPPEAPDATPARSEVVDVPGNAGLTDAHKAERVAAYYTPFRDAVAQVIGRRSNPVLITVHTFTPVYHGTPREVEIGVLHDVDTRFADALLAVDLPALKVLRNAPYGPDDGVTHTLREHALPQGRLNVMLEVRNDLVADAPAQIAMADRLSQWITAALAKTEATTC